MLAFIAAVVAALGVEGSRRPEIELPEGVRVFEELDGWYLLEATSPQGFSLLERAVAGREPADGYFEDYVDQEHFLYLASQAGDLVASLVIEQDQPDYPRDLLPAVGLEEIPWGARDALAGWLGDRGFSISEVSDEDNVDIRTLWRPDRWLAEVEQVNESALASALTSFAARRVQPWRPWGLDIGFDAAGMRLSKPVGLTMRRGKLYERQFVAAWLWPCVDDQDAERVCLLVGFARPEIREAKPGQPWTGRLELLPAPERDLGEEAGLARFMEAVMSLDNWGPISEAFSVDVGPSSGEVWRQGYEALVELLERTVSSLPAGSTLSDPDAWDAGVLTDNFEVVRATMLGELRRHGEPQLVRGE